jgi:peptidyl-prolyl cis-trans isomerase D
MSERFKVITTRILMLGVLIAAGGAMVFTGNSDTVRQNIGNQNIAKIGNKTITARQFEMTYARRIAQSGMTDTMARQMGVPAMVLQSEIERQTLLQAAQKLGIRIDNKYVANQLRKQLDQVQLTGTPQEKLQMILNQQKLTESELVDLLRGDFAMNVLASTVTTGDLQIPAPLLRSAYQADKQTRSADMITISAAQVKNKPVTDKEVNAFFNENKEAYRTPEKRDISALVLPQSLFVKDIKIPAVDVKAYFDENQDKFMGSERVQLEQIIVQDEAAAQKIIDSKPADLSSYKKDQAQYLKADWYGKTTLPKEFVAELFPNTPKGFVGPVKTSLGWHVLNVSGYEKAKPLAFEDVKANIERELKDEKLDAHMTEFTNELDRMISEEASVDAIAEKYKLTPVSIKDIQSSTMEAQLKASSLSTSAQQRIQDAIFTLQDNETSPLMDTSAGDYVLIQVTKVIPSIIPDLKAIKSTVTADAQKSYDAKALVQKSEALVGTYDATKPAAFDKAVKDAGLTVKSVPASTKAAIEKTYGKQTAELLYTLSPENSLSYVQTPNEVTLIRLKDIVQSKDNPDEKTADTLRDAVKNNMIQELQLQFLQAWQKDLTVDINSGLLQSAFGPQDQSQDKVN